MNVAYSSLSSEHATVDMNTCVNFMVILVYLRESADRQSEVFGKC